MNQKTMTAFAVSTMISAGLSGVANAVFLAPTSYPDRITDTFSRDDNLNSTTADSGQTWNASSWSTNGSTLDITGTGVANIGSGFLAPDRRYTLSMDLTFGSLLIGRVANPSNLAFGFTTAPSLGSPTAGVLGGSLWTSFSDFNFFGEDPLVQQNSTVSTQASHTFSIDLITGSDTSSSNLVWKVDGTQVGNQVQVDASSVNGIFIESINSGIGGVDNLRLSESAVPEPSSLFLVVLSGMGIVLRRKR